MSLIRPSNTIFDPFSVDLWQPFPFPNPTSLFSFPRPSSSSLVETRVDWKETPEAHVFMADLPGLRKGEVKVEVEEGNVLQISGGRSREEEEEEEGEAWHRVERISGSFLRRFQLPENARMDRARAELESGVLTVTIPKDAPKKPEIKSIEISG